MWNLLLLDCVTILVFLGWGGGGGLGCGGDDLNKVIHCSVYWGNKV